MRSEKNYQFKPEITKPGGSVKKEHTPAVKSVENNRVVAKKPSQHGRFSRFKVLIPVIGFAIISGGLLLAVSLASPRETTTSETPGLVNVIDDADAYGEVGLAHSTGDIDPGILGDISDPLEAADITERQLVCPDVPNDCAGPIQDLIDSIDERPLKIRFSASTSSDHIIFNKTVNLAQQVSVVGVNNPLVRTAGSAKSVFNLSQAQDTSVSGFEVDINGCQNGIQSIFDLNAEEDSQIASNLHISSISIISGDRYLDEAGQTQLHFKDYSRCDFLQLNSDTNGLFVSNIRGDHFRKFISIERGSHQRIAIIGNSMDLMGQEYIRTASEANIDLMQIVSNRFSKIAASPDSVSDQKTSLIDLATGQINQLNISGNIIESPSYKTASVTAGDHKISPQIVPSLSRSLIEIGSVDQMNIENNLLQSSSGDGVVLLNSDTIGSIRDNRILSIEGGALLTSTDQTISVEITNNLID